MRKTAILLAALMIVCSFSSVAVTADGLFVSAGTVTLPTEGDADTMLIGWTYTDGEDTVVLAPGAQFTAESDVNLTPLYLDLNIVAGASVRTATPAGLRFTSTVSEPHYQALVATGATFELGTVIAPTDYITDEFTYADITADGESCLRIPCKVFWSQDENIRTFTGVISNILEKNYNRSFSARAYVSVTYEDGSSRTFYSGYDSGANSRSAYGVACAALADGDSIPSDEAKAVLQNYFDIVGIDISLIVPVAGAKVTDPVVNTESAHYTMDYDWMCQNSKMTETYMDNKGYQITMTVEAKDGPAIGENTAIRFNGAIVEEGRYTLENGVLTIVRRYPLGDYTWGY